MIYLQAKFTVAGNVKVTVSVQQTAKLQFNSAHSSFVAFKVKDTGVGINPVELKKIFEPFYQSRRDDRSSGLGLNTVLQLCASMGGYTFAKSQGIGKGTSVYFCIPNLVTNSAIFSTSVNIPQSNI